MVRGNVNRRLTMPLYKPNKPCALMYAVASAIKGLAFRCCWIMISSAGPLTNDEVDPAARAMAICPAWPLSLPVNFFAVIS